MTTHDQIYKVTPRHDEPVPCDCWGGDVRAWYRAIMLQLKAGLAIERCDQQIMAEIKGWAIEHNGAGWIARHPDGLVTIRLPESVANKLTGGKRNG